MVDVSNKSPTNREASASCFIQMKNETLKQIRDNTLKKGDVLTVAKIAGIQAAKRTDELIPLCHQLQLSQVDISCELQSNGVLVICKTIAASQKTGVEMESIIGATMAAITIFDMCKAIDNEMIITAIQVNYKTGGNNNHHRNK